MKARLIEFSDDFMINREYWVVCVGELDVKYTTHNRGQVEEVEIKSCTRDHRRPVVNLPDEVAKAVREYRQAQK